MNRKRPITSWVTVIYTLMFLITFIWPDDSDMQVEAECILTFGVFLAYIGAHLHWASEYQKTFPDADYFSWYLVQMLNNQPRLNALAKIAFRYLQMLALSILAIACRIFIESSIG